MSRRKIRAHYEHMSEFETGRAFGLKEAVNESRFLLCPDDRRKRVWRRPGQRVDPGLTVEHHTDPQQGVMVWGAISFDSKIPLVVIPGTLTAQRYVDDILRPVVLPFHSHHPGLTFQQDNTARVTMDCLQSCQTLPWPARSPDLSPIEHIWDVMGRRLQPSRNIDYSARQLETIWQEIPHHTIRNLYQSMTRWVAACIQARTWWNLGILESSLGRSRTGSEAGVLPEDGDVNQPPWIQSESLSEKDSRQSDSRRRKEETRPFAGAFEKRAWLIRDTTCKMTSTMINTPLENDQNYSSWKYNTKMMLIERELWKYVTEPTPDEEASRTIFNMKQEKALAMIALTISPSQQIHIMDCTTAREAWDTLEQVYEPKSRSRILQLKKQFISIRFEEQETMTNYLGRLKICSDHLREAGAEMQDQDLAYSMLAGLPESYDGIIMTFSNVEDKEFTSSKVKHVLLAEYERRMARRVYNTNEALQFGTTTRKEDKKKKNFTCYKCGKEGTYREIMQRKG
ncbi:hypothetical protein LAZ67_10000543 [Cordylochernes scorpioides]|uniref:Tc1-like transposase DDE domain-containing protein n=1 Tax=Cordylochernes scorpioides TaxID=51811 RepID=A0ABY6KV67_9ARAC|nr:hypothetical protein LAZ67_10000543 [Cordylochernes scorpioides]